MALGGYLSDDSAGNIAALQCGQCGVGSSGAMEASKPPDVCGSKSNARNSSGTLGANSTQLSTNSRLFFMPPEKNPRASCLDRAGKIFDACVINFQGYAAADGHFARVAEDAQNR